MARIRIDVSPDRMVAHATVSEGAGDVDVGAALAEARVLYGIEEALVEQIVRASADPAFRLARTPIARGTPPGRGADGTFVAAFETEIRPGTLREDGSLDFQDRDLVKVVRAGDEIGQLIPPGEGAPGRRVDGTPIPGSAGRRAALLLGSNVTCSETGVVVARIDGAVAHVPARSVDVVQHFAHKGDVDLHSGHLDMVGSISVSGAVTSGFRVRATADVDVRGACDAGQVLAGGHVRIGGLVRGGKDGVVEAAGDITAGAAESATLSAGRHLALRDAVHATLQAERITVSSHVRGGHAAAELSVVVGDAGSPAGAITVLEAGTPRRSREDLSRAIARAKAHRQTAARSDERGAGGKNGRARAAIADRALVDTLERARRRDELLGEAVVEVRGTLFPGTVIRMGDQRYQVDWEAQALRISYDFATRSLRADRAEPLRGPTR